MQLPDGSWGTVPVIPGALQVLSGKLLTRWTNGRLRPGRHRVIAGGTDTRRSTAVFCYPSLDMTVQPLAPFVGADGPAEPGVLVWDHVSSGCRTTWRSSAARIRSPRGARASRTWRPWPTPRPAAKRPYAAA